MVKCVLHFWLLDLLGLWFIQLPPAAKQDQHAHCCQEFFDFFHFISFLKKLLVHVLQALLELKLPPLQKALELCQEKKPSYPRSLAGYLERLNIKNPQCILSRLVSPTASEGDIQRKRDCWFPLRFVSRVVYSQGGWKQRLVMWMHYILHSKLPLTVSPSINVCKL